MCPTIFSVLQISLYTASCTDVIHCAAVLYTTPPHCRTTCRRTMWRRIPHRICIVPPVVSHITGVKRNQSQKLRDFNAPSWDRTNGPRPNIGLRKFLILVIVACTDLCATFKEAWFKY